MAYWHLVGTADLTYTPQDILEKLERVKKKLQTKEEYLYLDLDITEEQINGYIELINKLLKAKNLENN